MNGQQQEPKPKAESPLNDATVRALYKILFQHCGERGDNEGAVETLERIIRERDSLMESFALCKACGMPHKAGADGEDTGSANGTCRRFR